MTEELKDQLHLAEHSILTTERLVLRPLTLADAADMYEYGSDEETTKFVFPLHTSLNSTRESIAAHFLSAPLGKFALELKETKKMIGTIELRVKSAHRQGEIGYALNRTFWGQGLMTEATKKIIEFGFKVIELERIYAVHAEKNPASGKVMLKSGLKYEGIALNSEKFRGEMINVITYGVTHQEYLLNLGGKDDKNV